MALTRNRSAWIWVTIAAITFASFARAEGVRHSARAGAQGALELLAKGQSHSLAAMPGIAQMVPRRSSRRIATLLQVSGIGAWMAILPLLFVTLISPWSALASVTLPRSGRAPAAPHLAFSFQRPPPRLG
jgi:hypothetical protein